MFNEEKYLSIPGETIAERSGGNNFDKIKEIFGDSLKIYGSEKEFIRKHVEELRFLPIDLAKDMRNLGLQIFVGDSKIVDLLRENKGIKVRLQGIASKLFDVGNINNYGGAYSPETKAIYIGVPDFHQEIPFMLHEYGHAVWHLGGLENYNFFEKMHKKLFVKLDEELQVGEPGNIVGVNELIAESFAEYCKLSKEEFILIYDSEIHRYWGEFKEIGIVGVRKHKK